MNINGNTLEYVGSGVGNTRIVYPVIDEDPALLKFLNDGFTRMNSHEYHKMGVLYNAFVEPKYGSWFKNRHREFIHSIHADSGGLQVMTLGKKITPELKLEIYKQQATNADLGMCFDEIPVVTDGKTSVATTAGRFFDPTIVRERALKTGANILEQERIFQELGTSCDVCSIIQGHDGDSLKVWADSIREVIGHDFKRVSFTDTAMGVGPLEDVKVAFYGGLYKGTAEQLHLLGVGSIRRLLPVLIFMQSGFYKDLHISYDSTTHTSGVQKGKYYIGGDEKVIFFPRQMSNEWERIYADLQKIYPFPYDIEYFYKMSTTSPTKNQKDGGEHSGPIYTSFALFGGSVLNFIKDVNRIVEDPDYLINSVVKRPLEKNIYRSLYEVKTLEDFKSWERSEGRYLKSDPLAIRTQGTLNDFF